MTLRVAVRVKPGAAREHVGGAWSAEGAAPRLLVSVRERAVDGAATEAVRRAVAEAFGVRPRHVVLASGRTSRSKLFEIDVDEKAGRTRLHDLLAG